MIGMATGTDLPFVLSLFVLIVVSCSRIPPTTSSTDVPVSASAKAAAVQYWNRVVGSNSHPPPSLLAHLSNSSPIDIIANLNEAGVSFGDSKSYDDIKMVTGVTGGENFLYFYNRGSDGGDHDSDDALWVFYGRGSDGNGDHASDDAFWVFYDRGSDDNHVDKQKQSSNFFRESQLKKGATMPIPNHGRETPHLNFLPRNIAGMIPMSADAIRKIYHIPADAPMGRAVAKTIDGCKRAPPEGETRRCVTSAEDMIDYVVSSLGANGSLTARTTTNHAGMGGNVVVGGVKAANGGELGHVVVCHQATFPYLMYHCHNVPRTKLYEVEILDPETQETDNLAAALCHFDTSVWSPGHAAFMALGYERGMEVCHWIHPTAMAWTTVM